MSKLRITLALPLLATGLISQAALAERLEIVSNSEAGNLICFVETDEAQTVDLTPLCSPRGKNGLLAPRGTITDADLSPFSGLGGMDRPGSLRPVSLQGLSASTPQRKLTYGTGKFTYTPMVSDNPWAIWLPPPSSGGGDSGGGNCGSPSDTASDGSSCGGRASSVKPGGR